MDCSETNPRVLIRAKRAFVGDVNLMSTTSSDFTNFAEEVIARCQKLASFSEDAGGTRRTFLSAPMRDCHRELSSWMKALRMNVSVDAVGNLRSEERRVGKECKSWWLAYHEEERVGT